MSWYSMERGWMDDRMWKHDKYTKREAWCWLIENAAYEANDDFVKGEKVDIPIGSLIKTERQLAKEWKWGRQRVRTFLKNLEKDEKIVVNLTQQLTQINVLNYKTYQKKQPRKKPSANPAATQQQPSYKQDNKLTTKQIEIFFNRFMENYPCNLEEEAARKNFVKEIKIVEPEHLIGCAKSYAEFVDKENKQEYMFKAKNFLGKKCYKDFEPEDQNRKSWETKLELYKKGKWIDAWGSHPEINGWSTAKHGEVPDDIKKQFIQINRDNSTGSSV